MPAASQRSAPQLYIKGVTPKPARLLKDKDGSGKVAAWVVFIKLGAPPTVIPIPPPHDPYSYTTWLKKDKDPNKRELTGVQYRKMVKDTLLGKGSLAAGTLRRPRKPINLLHDRDPAHTSKAFKTFTVNYNINAELLPPRSPDLNPLDYGVFGPAQKKLEAEMELRPMSFEQQCSFMEGAIKMANVDAAIAALPLRIKRCIQAKGGHFE